MRSDIFIINFSAFICCVFRFITFELLDGHSVGVKWITTGSFTNTLKKVSRSIKAKDGWASEVSTNYKVF